ncbi:cbb3-type cytochrome c oxidase subunit I [Pseudogracilibacillus auburnensis]|uniref:cbb3-type cytochrome c oxidase subunit I n=1 Tax=Pseudogracilibacillus auburnensis TaxID=1494959 RepID=UPI001A977906|nr:cbb3-type cytochrome c oxidase subunit I [Pseudogracilibacillus auburnensis]MBO1003005.1 cbb3-type cytochrome c oxidase subunit I [Pseudogracilibacillus auburnensis]
MSDITLDKDEHGNVLTDFDFEQKDANLIMSYIIFSIIAIFLGGLAGLLQMMQRSGWITLPNWLTYYQLLTAHGVLLALVFTTFFIIGYLFSGVTRTLDGKLTPGARTLGWIGFYLMAIGSLVGTAIILMNDGTVLYTFYAPMQASPWFYVSLALLIVGSWFSSAGILAAYIHWRKKNKNQASPLFAYMSVATLILWIHASLAVAVSVVFFLIPWAFGWVPRVDVSLTRILFWYFGHALVYFWLLPAYIYWYVNIPQVIGGKIFSNSLPRLTFILLILFSVPVGIHHQLTEPGIQSFWKFLQVVLTMMVVVPSLITAFSVVATFELTGRSKGGKGLFGWVTKLPWKDARFFATILAMIIFVPAGAGGIINGSYQLNQMVHNTWFITGHFHLTLATSVVLTFFAISYWLIPVLTKRVFTKGLNRLAIVQTICWVVGVLLMGGIMHFAGIKGAPRRTAHSTYGDHELALSWLSYSQIIAIGGVLLFIAIVLVLYIWIKLIFFAPKSEKTIEYPIGVINERAEDPPPILERWRVWIGVSIALSVIAYAVPIYQVVVNNDPGSLPFRTW